MVSPKTTQETMILDNRSVPNSQPQGKQKGNRQVQSRREVLLQLLRGGIESNPGPPKSKKKSSSVRGGKIKIKMPKKRAVARGPFATLGRAASRFLGGGPAGRLARSAGSYIGHITGMGDYQVNRNTLVTDNGPPLFGSGAQGMRVRHREFIRDFYGTAGFEGFTLALNPGLSATFPWLSQIARNFELYQFHGLIFEFKTTSATAVSSTNTALGTVVMATQYNSQKDDFASKMEMEAYEFCTSTVPCHSMIHPVECKPIYNSLARYYVRTSPVQELFNILQYDLGKMQIASQGMQAQSTIGELWVSYDVELLKPRLNADTSVNTNTVFHIQSYPALSATIQQSGNVAILGQVPASAPVFNTAGMSFNTSVVSTILSLHIDMPLPGRYLVSLNFKTGNSVAGFLSQVTGFSLGGNLGEFNLYDLNTRSVRCIMDGTNVSGLYTGGGLTHQQCVDVRAAGKTTANRLTINLDRLNQLATWTGGFDLLITSLPTNVRAPSSYFEHRLDDRLMNILRDRLYLLEAAQTCDEDLRSYQVVKRQTSEEKREEAKDDDPVECPEQLVSQKTSSSSGGSNEESSKLGIVSPHCLRRQESIPIGKGSFVNKLFF